MPLQYKIPQNVEREDQILSFLTFRQLGILAAGGAFCYFLYILLAPVFYVEVWGPIVFIPAALTACVAFLDIGGVTFTKWFLLFIEFVVNPKKRIWNNKKSFASELQAMLVATPKKTQNKKKLPQKKQSMPEKSPKTIAELVQDIEGVEKQDTTIVPMDIADDDPVDEKEKTKHEKLMDLMEQQKKIGTFAPVATPETKAQAVSAPVPDLKGESEKIHQATTNKIKEVRPETVEQVAHEEILQSNFDKLNNIQPKKGKL